MEENIIDFCAIGALQALQEAAFIGGVISFVSFVVGYLLCAHLNRREK